MFPALVVTLAALGAASSLTRQDPKPRPLGAMTGEFPATFSSIRGFASLGEGRIVISDMREERLSLIDFATGNTKPLGRKGGGPLEYIGLGGLYRAKGGGVALYDQNRVRLLGVTPAGELAELPPIPTPPGGRSYNVSDKGPDMYIPDSLGHVYRFPQLTMQDMTGGSSQGGGPTRRPDRPFVRVRPSGAQDTVAALRQPEMRAADAGGGVMMSQLVTFSSADILAVAPDGWVAVVRSGPYRVEWYRPDGAVVRGPVIAYTPLKVTEADKAAYIRRISGQTANVTRSNQSGATQAPVQVGGGREPLFADAKPPFTREVPLIDEAGRLWVERYWDNEAAGRVYDVFDRAGALTDRVLAPAGVRLVGFDRGSAYGVKTDEDDLLHLQRFRIR